MKTIVSLIGLISTLAITNALAYERVLLDTYTAPQNWEISSRFEARQAFLCSHAHPARRTAGRRLYRRY